MNDTKKQSKKKGCLIAFVAFLILILIGGVLSDESDNVRTNSNEQNQENIKSVKNEKEYTKLDAYNFAKEEVKSKLKSPSSAKFPGLFEKKDHITTLAFNEFQISSWVESQNGFGATIRSKWTCKVKFSDKRVSVTDIIIM